MIEVEVAVDVTIVVHEVGPSGVRKWDQRVETLLEENWVAGNGLRPQDERGRNGKGECDTKD